MRAILKLYFNIFFSWNYTMLTNFTLLFLFWQIWKPIWGQMPYSITLCNEQWIFKSTCHTNGELNMDISSFIMSSVSMRLISILFIQLLKISNFKTFSFVSGTIAQVSHQHKTKLNKSRDKLMSCEKSWSEISVSIISSYF